ncbi:regulatory protein RecX [Desulforamulus reducens MI-1]|uniref:Regulatory protein RecX n=1 Tax=Desulforamulus reducens (strain ATCC BAA-1160 / DSM 100696 / MI-1) TaxID=349161 RepID=A4J5K4_DESRM|nr:RecX family transcriptional regulator [Desulforamulus reducens]ABO50357.1 regulatory protein RecX [Desulforamulus reducens MI-1]
MSIVTALEVQKKNNQRYSLFLDGKYAFGVHEDTLIQFQLFNIIGKELPDYIIQQIIRAENKHQIISYAISLLSYRARSSHELRTRMRDKGYQVAVVEETIETLQRLGYIDDIEFAKVFINDRQRLKKVGKKLIRQELWQKGISKDIINDLLEQATDDEQEYQRAKTLAIKKITSYRKDDERTKQRKLYSYLIRKGYSFSIASSVIKELFS